MNEKIPVQTPVESPWQSPVSTAPLTPVEVVASPIAYQRVRTGLKAIYYSVGLGVLVFILTFVNGMIEGSVGPEVGFGIAMAMSVLIFACLIGSLIGMVMCCFAPNSNERTLIGIAIACFAFNVVVVIVNAVEILPAVASGVLALAGMVANFLPILFFCLFCRAVGKNINSQFLVKRSKSALVWYSVTSVLLVVFLVAIGAGAVSMIGSRGAADRESMQTFFVILGFGGLALFVFCVVTLFKFIRMLTDGIDVLTVTK